jgi:hypothetical protein
VKKSDPSEKDTGIKPEISKEQIEKIKKFNSSIKFVAQFLSQLNGDPFNSVAINIKKNCQVFKKSKVFDYMNSRIIQVQSNNKRLNKKAKTSKNARQSSSQMMLVGILRLFKEFYEHLTACREVYKKEMIKPLRKLLKTINSVIWKRCKVNCKLFEFTEISKYFEKLQSNKKVKKGKQDNNQEKVRNNNVEILVNLLKEFQESSSTEKEPDNKNEKQQVPFRKEVENKPKSRTENEQKNEGNVKQQSATSNNSQKTEKYQRKPKEDYRLLI